jgi:hypothetical protein
MGFDLIGIERRTWPGQGVGPFYAPAHALGARANREMTYHSRSCLTAHLVRSNFYL